MVTAPAVAQESQPLMLEEVIVTAQRRAQSLSDIPISISAVSGDKIAASELLKKTPGSYVKSELL